MIVELALDRHSLHGHFSRDLPPVMTIDSGDSVRFATPSARWDLADGTPFDDGTGEDEPA